MQMTDIKKLADLAKMQIPEDEALQISADLDKILGYVGQIEKVNTEEVSLSQERLHNVFREDENSHQSGEFSETLINAAPDKKDGYIKVKKIL